MRDLWYATNLVEFCTQLQDASHIFDYSWGSEQKWRYRLGTQQKLLRQCNRDVLPFL